MEDGGGHVGQGAVPDGGAGGGGDVDEGDGVGGVGGIGAAVVVEGMVGVAVVGGDDDVVAHGLGRFDHLVQALVDGLHGGGDGGVDTGVAHHVGVGEVDHHPVVVAGAEGRDETVFHLVGRHLGLQVVGGHGGRVDQDAVLAGEGFLAPAVDEGGDMGVFLGLGNMELPQAQAREVFAEGIVEVLLGEEDMDAGERVVVGRHAVVLEVRDGGHVLLRDVVLSEGDGDFLGAVAAEVEEDDDIARLDATVDGAVDEGFHELVGVLVGLGVGVVARLDTRHHVGHGAALSVDNEVVSKLDAVPMLVAVHGVVAADGGGHHAGAGGLHVLLQVDDEALAGPGVGIAAVHEAVDVAVEDAILGGDVDEFLEVVYRGVDAAVGGQPHEVEAMAGGLGVGVGRLDFGVVEDGIVGAGAVDAHEVLVDNASSTDVEVAGLRVAHLSGREAHSLAGGLEDGMGVGSVEVVDVGRGGLGDDVGNALVADAPAVEDDEEHLAVRVGRVVGDRILLRAGAQHYRPEDNHRDAPQGEK